jgi:hypothetical protein
MDATSYPKCGLKPQPVPQLRSDLGVDRARAILSGRNKWVNGTVLHYYFFDRDTDGEQVHLADGSTRFVSWVGADAQREVVRQAFQAWKDLGIGLEFREVFDRAEAEIRVGFMFDFDGSWSYVGRGVLAQGVNSRTMNFGWDLTADDYGMTTALHEIGHTLGMPHEHQNPFAGIQWNEQAVYDYFSGPPNRWDSDTTFHNVLRKLDASEVLGSTWDPDSVMQYAFPAGLITQPAQYHGGVNPPGTLSPVDISYARTWYPALEPTLPLLEPFSSAAVDLAPGEQADFQLRPSATREYEIGTFGASDTVLVLFEQVGDELRYVEGDDDSGEDRNARLTVKLFQGREYVVRVRCYYSWASARTAVMYW